MDLYAKAQSLGIQTEYIDGSGHRRVTTPEALTAILAALPPHTPRRIVIDPVVVRGGHGGQTQLSEAAQLPVQWKLTNGSAVLAQGGADARNVTWPGGLPEGVHRLQLTDASGSEELPLLVAPDGAFGGAFDRCWVIAVQLYGVRSARNWGVGDFTDLEGLLAFAHRLGATASGSIRCMRCSTIGLAIAARIRRTAGCSSTRCISTSRRFPNSAAMRRRRLRWRTSAVTTWSTMSALRR